jgi:hypothetical protein
MELDGGVIHYEGRLKGVGPEIGTGPKKVEKLGDLYGIFYIFSYVHEVCVYVYGQYGRYVGGGGGWRDSL